MGYPGNPELSAQAQERVLSAFRQVVTKLQDGQRENALIGLEFVLRLDPTFGPALNLQRQLASGASEIDLSEIMVQLEAPTSEAINTSLIDAVDAFNNRDFMTAKAYAEKVLVEEPGHTEAKQLLAQVQDALKVETQVNYFLGQARQALSTGDAQEASNFVLMAQALDPHHADIARALQEIEARAGSMPVGGFDQPPAGGDGGGISFETMDEQVASAPEMGVQPPVDPPAFSSEGGGFGVAPEPPPAAQPTHDDGFGSPTFGQAPAESSLFDAAPAGAGTSPWAEPEEPQAPAGSDFALPGPAETASPPSQGFNSPAGDVADLFQSEPAAPTPSAAPEPASVPRAADDVATREEQTIQALLEAGRTALATEDYREAIHHLSRIGLIDPHHHEATTRLAEAREAQAGIDERVEQLLFDAQDAAMGGEQHRLAELVGTIQNLDPNSIEAFDLQAGMAGDEPSPAPAVEPGAPAMPDLDDDLFSEELSLDLPAGNIASPVMDLASPAPPPPSKERSLPLKKIGMIAAAAAVVIGALAVGMLFLSGGDDTDLEDRTTLVSNLLRQADDLMKQGRGDEALHLLQSFAADGIEKQRIDRRIATYQKQLAPPTPTPVPETAVEANQLLESGRWFAAFEAIHAGLAEFPNDPGLQELRAQILDVEPRLGSLFSSLRTKDYRTAASIGEEIESAHPSQTEVGDLIERCLFNAALLEMRAYNLAGAASFLRRFEERNAEDEEVQRILRFVASYKQRPVDMQLRVFVGSLQAR